MVKAKKVVKKSHPKKCKKWSALEALVRCRLHWQYLAKSGSFYKSSFTLADRWQSHCACCEYTRQHKITDCMKCPLTGYAWKNGGCITGDSSLYQGWMDACTRTEHKKAAKKMVSACDAAIKDLIDEVDSHGRP